MFNKIYNDVIKAIGYKFDVSQIEKVEDYLVFGVYGEEDYLTILLDGETLCVSNSDQRINKEYNIHDTCISKDIIRLMCDLNYTFI